jgi:hypothetical protein
MATVDIAGFLSVLSASIFCTDSIFGWIIISSLIGLATLTNVAAWLSNNDEWLILNTSILVLSLALKTYNKLNVSSAIYLMGVTGEDIFLFK